MELKTKIRKILKEHYGEFNTILEHEYEETLTENLLEGSKRKREAWITYNQVILELKHSIKDLLRVKELQYKLTEECNYNETVINVIEEVRGRSPEMERLYNKIKNF